MAPLPLFHAWPPTRMLVGTQDGHCCPVSQARLPPFGGFRSLSVSHASTGYLVRRARGMADDGTSARCSATGRTSSAPHHEHTRMDALPRTAFKRRCCHAIRCHSHGNDARCAAPRLPRSIKDFALVKEIGNGAVSSVYYAFCRKSTLRVAIKIYNKAKLTKLNQRQVRLGLTLAMTFAAQSSIMIEIQVQACHQLQWHGQMHPYA